MFAYCNNNPVNCADPYGTISYSCIGDNHLFTPMMLAGCGGGGGGYGFALAGRPVQKAIEDTVSSDPATAQKHLNENGFTIYKGTLVFMANLPFNDSAFSFGVIGMDDYYGRCSPNVFANTINHEYGHARHFRMIGLIDYAMTVAAPSLTTAALTYVSDYVDDNYYNFPWERIADYLGGVDRGYAAGANTVGSIYWIYTLLYAYETRLW